MSPEYFIGLDVGQASEFTALAVLERPPVLSEKDLATDPVYSLRHLQRYPLGTAYTAIISAVVRLAGTPPLKDSAVLVVDQTAVGEAIVTMLHKAPFPGRIVPVAITAGQSVVENEDGLHLVPKKDLVTRLQLLLQGRRLKVPQRLREADLLVKELSNFRMKITLTANDPLIAWREGQHDDLVLAVALAAWLAEREMRWHAGAISWGGKSLMSEMPKDVLAVDDPDVDGNDDV